MWVSWAAPPACWWVQEPLGVAVAGCSLQCLPRHCNPSESKPCQCRDTATDSLTMHGTGRRRWGDQLVAGLPVLGSWLRQLPKC